MKETHWFSVGFNLVISGKTGSLAHLKILWLSECYSIWLITGCRLVTVLK